MIKNIKKKIEDNRRSNKIYWRLSVSLKDTVWEIIVFLRSLKEKRITLGEKYDYKIIKSRKKLPGTFWGITTFYNPAGYKNKSENYKKFRESSKKQGLKLLCVELAFNGSDFELTKNDADILLQLRCSSVLWQKERLLNIALDSLPKECDKVAWVDAEVIFDNDSWIEETCSLLEKYMIVQPYSSAAFLKKDDQFKEITDYPWGIGCGKRNNGMAYVISNFGKRKLNWFLEHGQPGLAWAGRRKIFDKLNFYDQHILGAGDLLMAHAFYDSDNKMLLKKLSAGLKETYCSWRRKIYKEVKGSVYFTDGQIIHLWHGQRKNRLYGEIDYVLGRYEFDPRHDMKISKNGCFEWNTKKSELHDDIRQYFFKRMEDK